MRRSLAEPKNLRASAPIIAGSFLVARHLATRSRRRAAGFRVIARSTRLMGQNRDTASSSVTLWRGRRDRGDIGRAQSLVNCWLCGDSSALFQSKDCVTLRPADPPPLPQGLRMPIRRQSIALALVAAVACLSALSAAAQSASDPVLAKVSGVEIRESDLALAEADIGQSLPPGAAEARRDALLAYLIDVTILATAAEAQKMQDAPGFARKLAFVRSKVLMEALLDQASKGAVTEEAMRKLYEESVSKLKPEEEVRARHILVDSEDKAKEVIAKLKAGGDFAALAKEYSKDPGAAEGGDLGYFTKDQMVAEFADAAFKMKPGDISDPVKTQFGWHVIKLEDRRKKPVPIFEQVKDQIEQFLVRKAQSDLVLKLRESAKVERTTPPAQTPAPAAKGKK